ncbi:MAG TPA: IclR family transcriptional regulator, partial [Tissierellaceae bacterium]|nr:IclR family transcriptional regulator [Tissierellaceae bacterium]
SGIYKILQDLVKGGFVIQSQSTKKYSVGPALYRLGYVYSERKGIWDVANPVLKAISKITEETVSIGIREGDDAILAYKLEGPHIIRLEDRVGRKYPLNAGAIGKLLAAYHNQDRIRKILSKSTLEKRTENTITDVKELLLEYEIIRSNGYAISNGENRAGSYGISAPIYDRSGNVWSCLCLAGPKYRFTERKIKNWINLVIDGANEISYRLGYEGEY